MGKPETKPRWIYRKAATNMNAVIVCAFVLGPIFYFILGSIKPQGMEWYICVLGIVILAIIIIVCLSSAISNYMLAKDAERDEILEKLERSELLAPCRLTGEAPPKEEKPLPPECSGPWLSKTPASTAADKTRILRAEKALASLWRK